MIEDLVAPVRSGKDRKPQLPIRPDNIPETTWAYLAGLIDGEGNLNLSKNTSIKTNCRGFTWSIKLQIYSGNQELLIKLRELVGTGAVYPGYRKDTPFITYTLTYWTKNLQIVLQRTMPYLILKKKLATITLDALQTKVRLGRTNNFALEQKLERLKEDFDLEFTTVIHRQKYLIQMGKAILDALEKEYMSNQEKKEGDKC